MPVSETALRIFDKLKGEVIAKSLKFKIRIFLIVRFDYRQKWVLFRQKCPFQYRNCCFYNKKCQYFTILKNEIGFWVDLMICMFAKLVKIMYSLMFCDKNKSQIVHMISD